MQIEVIGSNQLPHIRQRLLEFMNGHGDKRITLKGIRWLTDLSGNELENHGNCIIIATENGQLVGVIAVSKFGIHHSFIAVHKDYRRTGTAKLLMKEVFNSMDKFYGRVALDNIPSLNTCFSMGMVALKIEKGPTGKPTFVLGWGNWDRRSLG